MANTINIDPLSVVPIFVELFSGTERLGSGTAFAIQESGKSYLVTNWHIATGRHPDTNLPINLNGILPNTIGIWHHQKDALGSWYRKDLPLLSQSAKPQWIEHPKGREVDVVALPFSPDDTMQLYPLDLNLAATDLVLSPSEPVSILGFPLGFASSGRFAIWKTGHIASDLDLDYGNKPVFIIDATTKPGMSGSPVVARRSGMIQTSKGMQMGGGTTTRFLGVYSGRIHDQADIGMVWKPKVLSEILLNAATISTS